MPKLPTRAWLNRYADAAEAYRRAFREVQDQLRAADMGRIPSWCFAVDRMDIEEVRKLSEDLGTAEEERRRRRVALHAIAELMALTGDQEPSLGAAAEAIVSSLDGDPDAELDRFITVVNYAKAGGVIYLNGTFEPVTTRTGISSLPPESMHASQANNDD